MKNIKRIISILLCFVVLISAFSVQGSALVVEVAGGSYVAYTILIAALAACGVAVASTSVTPGNFQAILDAPGAEAVSALIGSTAILANSGSTYFHWTASEWATFTSWVMASGMLSGSMVVPGSGSTASIISNSFNGSLISSYFTAPTPSSNGIIGVNMGGATFTTSGSSGIYRYPSINLSNGSFYFQNTFNFYSDYAPCYLLVSPFYITSGSIPRISIGICLDSSGQVAHSSADIASASTLFTDTCNHISIAGRTYTMTYINGTIRATALPSASYGNLTIAPTANFSTTYGSLREWFSDVINTGSLVGDWSGLGNDVINPADRQTDLDIDVYPPIAIPDGISALPTEIGQGESIDIPLDPYVDRQTVEPGRDVINFNPPDWDEKVTDTNPGDVQPEVKVNPNTDVSPGDVSVPWADEQSWPVSYPDTVTGDLTDAPPYVEAPPEADTTPRDNTNRMKLSALWLSKFPFCIPWDLKQGVSQLVAPAEAPVFDIPFKNARLNIDETIHIDLTQYEIVASVSRWFFSATWVIILIMLTKKMIWK